MPETQKQNSAYIQGVGNHETHLKLDSLMLQVPSKTSCDKAESGGFSIRKTEALEITNASPLTVISCPSGRRVDAVE